MGPRPFGRGNLDARQITLAIGNLQWGRDHSAAEMWPARPSAMRCPATFNGAATIRPRKFCRKCRKTVKLADLQWGRDHSAAEMPPNVIAPSHPRNLQWGRDHSAAEIAVDRTQTHASGAPSMGPRPFGRGNCPGGSAVRNRRIPSMGPRPFGRGNQHRVSGLDGNLQPFNGAATIRPRKYRSQCGEAPQIAALQWGRDHSAAEIRLPTAWSSPCSLLQWGRDHSAAEIHDARALPLWLPSAFNGAATIRPRKCRRVAHETANREVPSMGPRPFGRGNPLGLMMLCVGGSPSMGPRPFGRGNARYRRDRYAFSGFLQWGRDHSAAEILRREE